MSDINIRRAKPVDVASLAECIDSAYSKFKSKIPDLPDVSDGLLMAIHEKSVWVAEKGDSIVGGVVLSPKEGYLILENVAVHPNSSGFGIGRMLVGKAESECQRLALAEIQLSTHRAMSDNVGLYEYLGWCIVSVEGNKVHMTKQFNLIE